MACVPLPTVPQPTLPEPLTIQPSLPTMEFDAELCCKLLPFPLTTPPVSLPPGTVNPGVAAIIAQSLKSVQDYIDALPLDCPRE